jgi:hypothetical protein
MIPFLLPVVLWLDARMESTVILVLLTWAIAVAICLLGLLLLTILNSSAGYSHSGSVPRRNGASALKIVVGSLLLIGGLYLSFRMIGWLTPLIEGATGLL